MMEPSHITPTVDSSKLLRPFQFHFSLSGNPAFKFRFDLCFGHVKLELQPYAQVLTLPNQDEFPNLSNALLPKD
jgi:hypothetical protein